MKMLKDFLWRLVTLFFSLYFKIVGRPRVSKELAKTLTLYEGLEFNELFSLIRVWDAPFEEINKAVPKSGKIVDLGCGDGSQTNYLGIASPKRNLIGIELNKDRVKEANKGISNTRFKNANAMTYKLPKSDGVILTHVLHHLPSKKDQEKLLEKIHTALKKNGTLVIVEIVQKPFLKYLFTWLTDAFTVPILFEKRLYDFSFHYRSEKEWDTLLGRLGYSYKKSYPHEGKPFSHILYRCQKQ